MNFDVFNGSLLVDALVALGLGEECCDLGLIAHKAPYSSTELRPFMVRFHTHEGQVVLHGVGLGMATADAILQRLVFGNRAVEGHRVVIGAPPFRVVLDVCLMAGVVWEERDVGTDR
jgi:hypothetical protein